MWANAHDSHETTWVETKTCTGHTTGDIQKSSGKGNRLIILLQVDGEQGWIELS